MSVDLNVLADYASQPVVGKFNQVRLFGADFMQDVEQVKANPQRSISDICRVILKGGRVLASSANVETTREVITAQRRIRLLDAQPDIIKDLTNIFTNKRTNAINGLSEATIDNFRTEVIENGFSFLINIFTN